MHPWLKISKQKIGNILFPVYFKRRSELEYWKERKQIEDKLNNTHFRYFFTIQFGLVEADYTDKRIIDIGCGPRGSLEWAITARERIGLDPLAHRYSKISPPTQGMQYIKGRVESIPFPDKHFDVVSSFNSLDHVENIGLAVQEIARVTRLGGWFLLLTDVGHIPTLCEPNNLSWSIVKEFQVFFDVIVESHYERIPSGIYQSIQSGIPYDHKNRTQRPGVLSVKFLRKPECRS